MMTSSNGNIFRVTGPLCGEFTGAGEFPTQRPVTQSFDFFDLRLNKRLSKQSWGWWFETSSRPLWRQCNDHGISYYQKWCFKIFHYCLMSAWAVAPIANWSQLYVDPRFGVHNYRDLWPVSVYEKTSWSNSLQNDDAIWCHRIWSYWFGSWSVASWCQAINLTINDLLSSAP